MNTITTAATSPRKLALYTTANNEWCDEPESAYLEIDAEQAQAIIALLVMATRFRADADRAGFLSTRYSVTAGTGERIPSFRLLRISFADDAQLGGKQPILVLPGDFSPDRLPTDDLRKTFRLY